MLRAMASKMADVTVVRAPTTSLWRSVRTCEAGHLAHPEPRPEDTERLQWRPGPPFRRTCSGYVLRAALVEWTEVRGEPRQRDVSPTASYGGAVGAVAKAGPGRGYRDGMFRPENPFPGRKWWSCSRGRKRPMARAHPQHCGGGAAPRRVRRRRQRAGVGQNGRGKGQLRGWTGKLDPVGVASRA